MREQKQQKCQFIFRDYDITWKKGLDLTISGKQTN